MTARSPTVVGVALLTCLVFFSLPSRCQDVNFCPPRCRCVTEVVNCTRAGLTSLPLRYPPSTTTVILDQNLLSSLPADAFKGSRHVLNLSLRNNNISSVSPNAFSHLSNLQQLQLDGNHLSELPADVFSPLSKLHKLSLSDNHLTLLALNASLPDLQHAEEIDLSANSISGQNDIPSGFSQLTKLRRLELGSSDAMLNLSGSFFDALADMRLDYLGLDYSPIQVVEPEAFNSLNRVQEIDLSYTLLGPSQLANVLTGLANSSINTLHMTYILTWSDSDTELHPDTLSGLSSTRLKVLNLEGNFMAFKSGLRNNFFRHVHHLTDLYLDNCQIHEVYRDAFKGLHKLKMLSLRGNFISCLTDCQFLAYGPELRSLQDLDLSDNVITEVGDNLRVSGAVFPRLQTLILRNNRITSLKVTMFEAMDSLKGLDLTENPIHTIEPSTFSSMHKLQDLFIQGSLHLQSLENGTFRGLRHLRHLRLNNNQISRIEQKAFHGLHRLEILEMNSNRLGEPSSGQLHLAYESRTLIQLDLGNNRMHSLPASVMLQHPKLEQLILHYNRISYLADGCLHTLRRLQTLDLSHNNIMELVESSFRGLDALKHLDLSGNPFLCSCSLKGFVDWLRFANVKLPSEENHMCLGPDDLRGTLLLDFRPSSWECKVKVIVVPILSVMGTLALIFGVCLLYCKIVLTRRELSMEEPMSPPPRRPSQPSTSSSSHHHRPRNCTWIRELLPMNGDLSPSSDEANPEEPLITEESPSEVST